MAPKTMTVVVDGKEIQRPVAEVIHAHFLDGSRHVIGLRPETKPGEVVLSAVDGPPIIIFCNKPDT
ncbi:hypothetical protein AE929_09785 [Xanthomonas arboricola]|uniref:Uncharacterized protein n=1 Tax=Xanthomonas campestris pv. juglandis TaxID=195709 RepID=A0A8E4ER67_XANCJ|nr:hypothetical protein [Xanthomonas arboricola]KOA98575.1 hypothetical protein AE920_14795 [Xanthomonas arboricola]KOB16825.1 hypothetical protein AE924_06650 [Xanthomonas arboricola]KOB25259.1 hypothetical protein AE927_16250 [Xanthomonas arboricola]KOB35724.1 hypothetical protein AE929_09785 [Xanthomonas arboricola]CAD1792591.1 hypothetical protein XSP_002299 [Xanthomonas arboricola pv. juglandis]